jgi:hypothetical protein
MLAAMRSAIPRLVDKYGAVIERSAAVAEVHPATLWRAVQRGDLLHPLPGVYVPAAAADHPAALVRAAGVYGEDRAAFSHTTALTVRALPVPNGGLVHLMGNEHCRLRAGPGVRVHRRRGLRLEPPEVLVRDGVQVTRLERSIVDAWPLLDRDAKLAPAICAVSRRMTTPGRLCAALDAAPRLAGRRYLIELIELLRMGCRSPLELWGYRRVFSGPEFASLRWQVPVEGDGRTVYLDAFDPETGVDYELDGTKYHASVRDRTRDLRRDAALATLGIIVIRFTHDQLVYQYDWVGQVALAVRAAHRDRRWSIPAAVRLT